MLVEQIKPNPIEYTVSPTTRDGEWLIVGKIWRSIVPDHEMARMVAYCMLDVSSNYFILFARLTEHIDYPFFLHGGN